MKVVHLNTHDVLGGAARSAWRLHEGLRRIGVDSRMLVRTKHGTSETVQSVDDGTMAAWHEKIATPWLQRRLPPDSPWFTVGCMDRDISAHPWVREADVIHLHWVAEWLSATAIAQLAALRKPLVWTFHDLWPVTCGNHFAGNNTPVDEQWQTGESLPEPLNAIGRREFERKLLMLAGQPVQVIVPSKWTGEMAKRSRIGGHWPVHQVTNSIETDIFSPSNMQAARERWQLPQDKVLLLFGCASIMERRKGFHKLVEALQLASPPADRAELVLFGADRPDITKIALQVHHVGSVGDDKAMAALFASADAYLCPTLEDTVPNTVIESLCCGTPVIGFATGGVPDFVTDGRNGLLAPCGDVPALATCINRFLLDGAFRDELRGGALATDKSHFAPEAQAAQIRDIYHTCVAQSHPMTLPAVAWDSPSNAMVPSEMSWLVQAAAEAVLRAGQQERVLREKLAVARAKLDKVRTSEQPRQIRSKPWWKFGA